MCCRLAKSGVRPQCSAAIYGEIAAGDIAGFIRRQKNDGPGNLFARSATADPGSVAEDYLIFDHARRYAVDRYRTFGKFHAIVLVSMITPALAAE